MADHHGSAGLIPSQKQHFVNDSSGVERRRHAPMNARRGDACPLEHRARRAEYPIGLPVDPRCPMTLLYAHGGFDLFLTLGNLGTSGFQQLGREAGRDVREMTIDAVEPG
jgi:hypothetical protein